MMALLKKRGKEQRVIITYGTHEVYQIQTTNLFGTQFMSTVLEMTTNEREDDNVAVLGGELQAHVEVIFKQFVIKTTKKKKKPSETL